MFSRIALFSLLTAAGALPQPKFYRTKRQTTVPQGPSTSNVARPRVGNVPYGQAITSCTQSGVIALTFDDGPNQYTEALLDIFAEYDDAHATFFVAGNNGQAGSIDCQGSYGDVLNKIYDAGHQIGHHTWDHPSMNGLSQQQFEQEIYYNEMAIRNQIGRIPTYFRPPFLECDGTCQNRLSNLGYHTINVDLDTNDWRYQTPETIQSAKDIFANGISSNPANALVLAHDIHQTTVFSLARFMIETALDAGYRLVTVGECLGDPASNWYRDAGGARCNGGGSDDEDPPSNPPGESPPPGDTETSPDGTCGGSTGYTCEGAFPLNGCCSQYGWCGTSSDHCGTGCQAGFGECN